MQKKNAFYVFSSPNWTAGLIAGKTKNDFSIEKSKDGESWYTSSMEKISKQDSAPFLFIQKHTAFSNCEVLEIQETVNKETGAKEQSVINTTAHKKADEIITLSSSTTHIIINFLAYNDEHFKHAKGSWFYVGRHVNPHYKSINIKTEKKSGYSEVAARDTIDGKITLHGDDFDLIAESNPSQDHIFLVEYGFGKKKLSSFTFRKSDCKLDHFTKSVELKLSSNDQYSMLLDAFDEELDLIRLAPAITPMRLCKRPICQIYTGGRKSLTTICGGSYYESEIIGDEVWDSKTLNRKYGFVKNAETVELNIENVDESINGLYTGNPLTGKYLRGEKGYIQIDKIASKGDSIDLRSLELKQKVVGGGSIDGVMWANGNRSEYHHTAGGDVSATAHTRFDLYRMHFYSGTPDGEHSLLYSSKHIIFNGDNAEGLGGFVSRGKFEMCKVVGSAASKDSFMLSDFSTVDSIYSRVLTGPGVKSVQNDGKEKTLYDLRPDDFAYQKGNYKKFIGLENHVFYSIRQTSVTTTEPTKYGINDFKQYFTSNIFPYSVGISTVGHPIPVNRSTWGNSSTWAFVDYKWPYFTGSRDVLNELEYRLRDYYTIKDTYLIHDVIKAILKKVAPNISHEGTPEYSQFLYSETPPLGFIDKRRAGTVLHIAPKSNVLKGNYDQAAQRAIISLKKLFDFLSKAFRCEWFIDDQNRLRIEHISYFLNGMSYDEENPNTTLNLLNKSDNFNKKPVLYDQAQVEYTLSEIPRKTTFKFSENSSEVFSGMSIEVQHGGLCDKSKTVEVTLDSFSADIDYMLSFPEEFSNDGFVFAWADKTSHEIPIPIFENVKDDEYAQTYVIDPQNGLCSWLYMQRYYLYETANNIELSSLSNNSMRPMRVVDAMTQKIRIQTQQHVNVYGSVKTQFGVGRIMSTSTDIDTGVTTLELKYKPA